MTQTKDLIKKMADFFKGDEYYEKGENARLELSPDDVRCMSNLIHELGKYKAEKKSRITHDKRRSNHKNSRTYDYS